MVKVSIVFAPDPDLGADPLDRSAQPRRLGEFIDGDDTDAFVVWREIGDQFEGGSRTHVVGSGIWENLSTDQIESALGALFDDGLGE